MAIHVVLVHPEIHWNTGNAAIRHDGALVAWGLNSSGQIGDSTTTQRTSPVPVSGPASVTTLALGDTHSLVVTPEGEAWTWGAGASGRLGDGTANRATPQAILADLSDWQPAAPTLSEPSGTLTEPQLITVQSSTSGSTIRYTANGSDPTGADADVPGSGAVEIAFSSLFRARVFAADRFPSPVARADYQLQSPAPAIDPHSGTYTSAQEVTITAAGPPSTIRYTLDGSEPTVSSTAYAGPFVVNTATTIKARAFPSNGWAPSAQSSATLTFNYGALEPPMAMPGGGVYANAQTVTLSAIAGATIRYTLDGTEPSTESTAYTSAIQVTTGTVNIKARAFHPDWDPSNVTAATYAIDTTPPTITANVWPRPNAAGWNNTPVTISFTCTDNIEVESCPEPAQVSSDGAAQVIQRNIADAGGNTSSISVTVNIDTIAPNVEISSPVTGGTTTALEISLTGSADDVGSGVSITKCNEQPASVSSGSASCTVPLSPGLNSVVLHVTDLAGNSASAGLLVTRGGNASSISLTPNARTVLVGQAFPLSLKDNFGISVIAATWTSSDDSIVSISQDDPPILRAVAAGSVTITATKNSMQSEAAVTVVAGVHLAEGTVAWNLPPTPGLGTLFPLYANPISETDPAMFAVEHAQWSTTKLRALSSIGEVLWTTEVPGLAVQADYAGGVLTHITANGIDSIARVAAPVHSPPWRFQSEGQLSNIVQSAAGTVFAIEIVTTNETNPGFSFIQDKRVIVVNGATGALIARIPLARVVSRSSPNINCGTPFGFQDYPATSGPVLDIDGNAHLLVRRYEAVRFGCLNGQITRDHGIDFVTIDAIGALSSRQVFSEFCATTVPGACHGLPTLRQIIPNPSGGALVTWDLIHNSTNQRHLTQIAANGAMTEQIVDATTGIGLVGDEGVAYVSVAGTWKALDIATWSPLFEFVGAPNKALHNGGVITHDGATLRTYLGNGSLHSSSPAAAHATSSVVKQREWISVNQDFAIEGQPIRAIGGPVAVETRLAFGYGLKTFNAVSQTCNEDIPFLIDHPQKNRRLKGVPPNHDYKYRFEKIAGSLWPSDDAEEPSLTISKAFDQWSAANVEQGPKPPLGVTFSKDEGSNVDIKLFHQFDVDLQLSDNGIPIGAQIIGQISQLTGYLSEIEMSFDNRDVTITPYYKKLTLHEIGHIVGLDHPSFRLAIPTVMNGPVDPFQDFRGFMSEVVTVCDRDRAREAVTRTWVPLP